MNHVDRIVLGAGLSGLLAARRAVQRGESVLIVESSERHGGALAPICFGGIEIDAGAEAFSTADPSAFTLVEQLGLKNQVVLPNADGARLVTAPQQAHRIPHGIYGIPASLDDPELQHLIPAAALTEARRRDTQPLTDLNKMSVAELVRCRLGPIFLTHLVDPLITGVHGTSADQINAHAVLAPVLTALKRTQSLCAAVAEIRSTHPRPGSAVASLTGGLHRLPTTLLTQLHKDGVHTLFQHTEPHLTSTPQGWHLRSHTQRWHATALTIATGARAFTTLTALLPHLTHPAPAPTTISTALAFALVESPQLNEHPLGTGALIPAHVGAAAKATTHTNAKWQWITEQLPPHTHIVRFSYAPNVLTPSTDLNTVIAHDLQRLYAVTDQRILHRVVVPWRDTLVVQPGTKTNDTTHPSLAQASALAAQHRIELCGPSTSGNGIRSLIAEHLQRSSSHE